MANNQHFINFLAVRMSCFASRLVCFPQHLHHRTARDTVPWPSPRLLVSFAVDASETCVMRLESRSVVSHLCQSASSIGHAEVGHTKLGAVSEGLHQYSRAIFAIFFQRFGNVKEGFLIFVSVKVNLRRRVHQHIVRMCPPGSSLHFRRRFECRRRLSQTLLESFVSFRIS